MIGSGAVLVDTTYIDNAAEALVAALDRAPAAHGQAAGGQQRRAASDRRAARIDLCRGRACRVPRASGAGRGGRRGAGSLVERAWALRGGAGDPPLTRFVVEQLSTAHWFDQRHTRAALDWRPRISLDEGFARLAASYR